MPNTRKSVGNQFPGRKRKRRFSGNQFTAENETDFVSTSAEKLKSASFDDIDIDDSHCYVILSFITVFGFLSQNLKCKHCDGDVQFTRTCVRGLGFNLVVTCGCCSSRISSSPLVNKAYEINRRFLLVLRLLGLGLHSANVFCSLMELSAGFCNKTFYAFVENLHTAAKCLFEIVQKKAVNEEKEKNAAAGNVENHLSVSGDGTWKKRGFQSLFGVATLIGKYTHKVIDLETKSSFCQGCSNWAGRKGTPEYDEWFADHEEHCSINHIGSAGKMEVDAITEMFARSDQLLGVKYATYIGDGDTKTFSAILKSNPYEDVTVQKKECVGHVQKRMGTRLREVKKKIAGLGGKGSGKLTDNLIKELTIYYGLAIRRNPHSESEMKKAIWATFDHKCSTDENPKHDNCPPGENSWCKWRVAEAQGTTASFKHPPALDEKVQKAIHPIYEALSNDDLLRRCTGGNTQNDNESLNALIWMLAPKHLHCGEKTVKIAVYIAASKFNEGYTAIVKLMTIMGIIVGRSALNFAQMTDRQRISAAEAKLNPYAKQARIQQRRILMQQNELYEEEEGLIYGPGIAD